MEIPPIKLVVMGYQLHQLRCPSCGGLTRSELLVGVPTGSFGPRVQAIAVVGTGAYHVSKRTMSQVMANLFGLLLSVGTMVNLEQATVQAGADPATEAQASVQQQPMAYLNETGWREG
jgi:hypothetical protein